MTYRETYLTGKALADKIRSGAMREERAAKRGAVEIDPNAGLIPRRQKQEQIQTQEIQSDNAFYQDLLMSYLLSNSEMGQEVQKREQGASGKAEKLFGEISVDITDDTVRAILNTIKSKESGGDYSVKNSKGSASGAYQFIDSTWRSLTSKYGIGTEYKSANQAPPEVQDRVAAAYVQEILTQNNNDVTKVPLVWYTGNAAGEISQEAVAVNNGLTPAKYQSMWLNEFNKYAGGEE